MPCLSLLSHITMVAARPLVIKAKQETAFVEPSQSQLSCLTSKFTIASQKATPSSARLAAPPSVRVQRATASTPHASGSRIICLSLASSGQPPCRSAAAATPTSRPTNCHQVGWSATYRATQLPSSTASSMTRTTARGVANAASTAIGPNNNIAGA